MTDATQNPAYRPACDSFFLLSSFTGNLDSVVKFGTLPPLLRRRRSLPRWGLPRADLQSKQSYFLHPAVSAALYSPMQGGRKARMSQQRPERPESSRGLEPTSRVSRSV